MAVWLVVNSAICIGFLANGLEPGVLFVMLPFMFVGGVLLLIFLYMLKGEFALMFDCRLSRAQRKLSNLRRHQLYKPADAFLSNSVAIGKVAA